MVIRLKKVGSFQKKVPARNGEILLETIVGLN